VSRYSGATWDNESPCTILELNLSLIESEEDPGSQRSSRVVKL